MRHKSVIVFIFLLLSFGINGYCKDYSVELRKSNKIAETPKLQGFPDLVSKFNLQTGNEQIINLKELGIYRPISYIYDGKRDILFINEYDGCFYNVKVVNLEKEIIIKTITLKLEEPDMVMAINPASGTLYITCWVDNKWQTSIFDTNYNLIQRTELILNISHVFPSTNNEIAYLVTYNNKDNKEYLVVFDEKSINLLKKKELTELAVKGEYAGIRDGKDGKILLEYRKDEDYENYVLYDPLDDKVLAKLDKIPWHAGEVYLDDSADNIIINDAKLVDAGNQRKVRQYTNKILIYSFSKKGKVKEIPIKEGSKIEAVKDKIYLKQNSAIQTESLK